MTNREWLESLSDLELAKWIKGNLYVYVTNTLYYKTGAPNYNHMSHRRIQDWLREEHKETRF